MIEKKKINKSQYSEGDIFLVPLSTGDYSIGLISRVSSRKIPLGYFFNVKFNLIPEKINDEIFDKKMLS